MKAFSRCKWERQAGMDRMIWLGIAAAEVAAVLRLTRVPERRWPAVLDGIRTMEQAALPHLNADKD